MHGFAKVATRFPSPMGNSISVPSVAGQPDSRRFQGQDEPVSGSQQVCSRDPGEDPDSLAMMQAQERVRRAGPLIFHSKTA
jgi:hypothetical protein